MILAYLTEKEKRWFSNLITFIVADDDYVMDTEQDYLVRYRMELGLEDLDTSLGFKKALELISENSTDIVKRSMLLELVCITLCDTHYLPVENVNLQAAAKAFGVSNLDDFLECAKELMPAQKKAYKLMGEW